MQQIPTCEGSFVIINLVYGVGAEVEIVMDENDFEGFFYPAVILAEDVNNICVVKYSTLLDEACVKPLIEFAEAQNVRHVPPAFMTRRFTMYDKVDVNVNDGWLYRKVVEKRGQMHTVYFASIEEWDTYHSSKLWVHIGVSMGLLMSTGCSWNARNTAIFVILILECPAIYIALRS